MDDWFAPAPVPIQEHHKLVAFCEKCEDWWKFVQDMSPTKEEATCPSCGGRPSSRHGFQITTQRTWNERTALRKVKKKR